MAEDGYHSGGDTSTGSTPLVQLESVTIRQDGRPVLTDVNFTITKGEFAYLVGKTGSGKSSLLKTLYADLELTEGRGMVAGISLNNIRPSEIPTLRRKVGIIFQDFQLLEDRTVAENLEFVLRATGWKEKSRIKTRMAEVLMQVGLGASERKMPHQLSGGEQQRASIARALLNEPPILLADEPTGNLDPEVAADILRLFQQINKNGTSVLMATHSYSLIQRFPACIFRCHEGILAKAEISDLGSLDP